MTFRKIVPFLAESFTCYAFDLVGLGNSFSGANEDYSSPGQAGVLRHCLEELGLFSCALLGNDSGGWVARELALLLRDQVSHLILTNTEIPGYRPPWIPAYQALAHLPGGAVVFRQLLRSRRWRHSSMAFGNCFQDTDLIDEEFGELFLSPLLNSPDRLNCSLRFLRHMSFRRMDEFRHLHGTLSMPVAFVWAAADPTFPEPKARDMALQFPHVERFTSIPEMKLFFHEEWPEAVASAVMECLAVVS